ncbi:hypothetical protein BGX38DRAFT_1218145 [Terfezia claveryi]|nr:hypothetical protein BGX38DRAFT_1218145 [Terfezia claveryi]
MQTPESGDYLLWWHFRQSMLVNLRGREEPVFDHNMPLRMNMVKEISEGSYAKETREV